jgi:hypothetical protein
MAQNAPQPPPAVADNGANILLNDTYGGVGNVTPPIRVAQASHRKRAAEELYLTTNGDTQEEFGQQKIFLLEQQANTTNNVLPGMAQALAQQHILYTQALAQLQTNLTLALTQLQNNLTQALAPINTQLHNMNARHFNSMVVGQNDALAPIHDNAGNPAPNFPATLNDLHNLTVQQQRQLLVFYGLPADATMIRPTRIQKLLGIRP